MGSFYFVIAYIAILFAISAYFMKKAVASFDEYGYCGRSLTIGYIFFTYLGTWVGGGTIIGLVSKSYDYGASQYWIIAMSCVVEIFFAVFFIERIRNTGVKSITEFFSLKFPKHNGIIRIPAAAAILIRNVTMVAMQLSALSYLITFIFDINRNLSLLLVFFVIVVYTVMSGLWGVAVTDVFQGLLQTACLIILSIVTVRVAGGFDSIEQYYTADSSPLNLFSTNLKWHEILLYIIAFGLFFLMNDQVNWERIYASKGEKTAKWGFMIPLVVTMMSLVAVAYLGVFQRVVFNGEAESQSVLYSFIFGLGGSKLMLVVMVGLIASIMSSADSFLLASGVLISEDIIKKFVIPDASDKEIIFFARIFVIVTGSIAFAFALNVEDILYLWLLGIGMTSVILIPGYFLTWFGKREATESILAGMIAGTIYVALMIFGVIDFGAAQVCIGMLINFCISILPVNSVINALPIKSDNHR